MPKLDPKLAAKKMRALGFTPLEPYPGSNNPWLCRCKRCKSQVTPRYNSVVIVGRGGCNFCAKKASAETRRKEAEKAALQLLSARNLTPLEPYQTALARWRVRCLGCGRAFFTSGNRIQQGNGCQKCSSRVRGEQQRMERAGEAEKFMISKGVKPLIEYPGAQKPWQSICLTCGAQTAPRLSGLKQGQGACLSCAVTKRTDLRKMPDKQARKLMQAGLVIPDPETQYPGLSKPWPSTCITCGRQVRPSLANIRKGHRGCKRCSMIEGGVGFDMWAPATVYLICHERLKSFKIGITSDRNRRARLLAHRNEGWTEIKDWQVSTGQKAVFVEGEILRWWREELQEPPHLKAKHLPQGGWTETVRMGAVPPSRIAQKVQSAIRNARGLPPLPDDPRKEPLHCIAERDGQQCDKISKVRNYCYNHYRRWRKYGDPWGGKWPSEETSCVIEVDGERCGQPIRSNDMCSVHYERWYTHGDPHLMKRPTPGTRSTTCIVEVDSKTCGRKVIGFQMCNRHYKHWKLYGDPLAGRFENPGQQCNVVEDGKQCVRDATCRGMCGKHYNRWHKHGDPTVTLRRKEGDSIPLCPIEERGVICNKPVHAKNMCRRHYRHFIV